MNQDQTPQLEPIPPFLRPVLVGDRGTPAYRAVVARAQRLRRNYPPDVALRFVKWDLDHHRLNPRDLCSVGWLLCNPAVLDVLEGGIGT